MKVLFSDTELRTLLQREEGQFLEFKSIWDRDTASRKVFDRRKVRDVIAEYVAAFANADGERKTITALFADLKGSTALIEGLDPEDARAIIDPALQLMATRQRT